MKIFILNPLLFTDELHGIARKRQPLELAYMASLFRGEHEVKLLDANALNLDLGQTVAEIKNFQPDILILTSTPLDRWEVPSHSHIKLLINNLIKTINVLDIPYVILTGAHGTIMPEKMLKETKVNFVVRGEPEMVVKDLVEKISVGEKDYSEIKGISYLQNGEIKNNADAKRIKNLDELPMPAYDLLPMEKYRYTFNDIPEPFSLMLTSRGCPFNCTYCLKVMMPDFYITRSPENVAEEIKYLTKKFGVKGIYFQDWEFLIDKKRIATICDLILKENLEIKWGCNARAPDVDEEIVKKMKDAGCVRINLGFETGSQKVLDLAQKKVKVEEMKRAFEILKKYEINVGIYSILNLPGETRQTIAETENFLAENDLKTMCAPNLPIPYLGTPLYEMLKKQEGKEVAWEDLDKYAGRVGVVQSPFLAKIYRWHYKYKYSLGRWYFLKPEFYGHFLKFIKNILKI
ncbi:MAG TPA: radical SAM protein [bacterium]|nr:radical SAM protein [bacterium]